jgi:peptide/nickel transport system substrate-binding protein
MKLKTISAILLASLSLAAANTLEAKTLRWSTQGDVLTFDPHSQNEGLNNTISEQVYEPLITRGKTMALEPSLAVSWQLLDPSTMRLKLREKVVFHDGAAFTADDVIFSITRALQKTSDFSAYMVGVKEAKKIDTYTVDIITNGPNPTLLDQLTEVRIINQAWATKHNVLKPQDFKAKEETFAARNANGTGPFMLKSSEPDVKTIMAINPKWWGKRESNVTEILYQPLKADATRVAALRSGEVDIISDPPAADVPSLKEMPTITVLEGNENRTIFFTFDQGRDELLYSNVKGKNPFKDIRVRQAIAHTIDADAIRKSVMRGQAVTSMSMIAPQVRGYTKDVEKRWPIDLAKAKKLLSDAGYPKGFEVTMDCPNNRYINDEKICIAIAGMLAKIDITIKLNSMPKATYFPKVQNGDTSMYLLGWGVPTFDSLYTLQSIMTTKGAGGNGNWNFANYSNAKIDAIVETMKTETDFAKRASLTKEALLLNLADVGHIPLHHQVIPWAMRKNVTAVHRADNRVYVKWINIK